MKKTLNNLIIVGTILFAVILGIIICLRGPSWRIIRSGSEAKHHTPATPRGDIYDINGEVIATSSTVYDVYLDCMIIQNAE